MTIVFMITTAVCFVAWIWAKVRWHLCEGEVELLQDLRKFTGRRVDQLQYKRDRLRKQCDELRTTIRRLRTTIDELRETVSCAADAVKRDQEAHNEHIENLESLYHQAVRTVMERHLNFYLKRDEQTRVQARRKSQCVEALLSAVPESSPDPTFLDVFIADYGPQENAEPED